MDLETPIPPSSAWLQKVMSRLQAGGYVPLMPSASGYPFAVAARKSRFEVTKFSFVETFFVFVELPTITPEIVKQFSTDAFCYALANVTCGLPCGLGEAVICYAVAIVPSLDERTASAVRQSAPPRHVAAFQMPVVYDMSRQNILFYEHTPLWGALYYPGLRKQIKRFLSG